MTTIEKKSLRVGKYVDANHVDSLVRTYKQERWKYNSERLGREDSLNLYYTVDELQEFLQRAKQEGADGIRIHFGVYPQTFTERPGYAGRQTTVFVATKFHETENGYVEKNVYVNGENGPQILAYNMTGAPDDTGDWGGIGVAIVDLGGKRVVR
jgi:hypothetical protein